MKPQLSAYIPAEPLLHELEEEDSLYCTKFPTIFLKSLFFFLVEIVKIYPSSRKIKWSQVETQRQFDDTKFNMK